MSTTIRQSIASTEYRRANITEIVQGQNINPTSDTVAWAFLGVSAVPTASTTFTAGSWDTGGPPYTARCLVGPNGDVTLATGSYSMWVKITDNPETPVIQVPGTLVIY